LDDRIEYFVGRNQNVSIYKAGSDLVVDWCARANLSSALQRLNLDLS